MVDYIFHSKLKKKEESQQIKSKFREYVPTSNNKPEITSSTKREQNSKDRVRMTTIHEQMYLEFNQQSKNSTQT